MNATNASNTLKAPNEASAGFSISRFLRSILREYLVVVAIVWLVLITVVVEPNFMTPANMLNIMRQFGPLVMVGLGGIYVELLADVAFRVAPFSRTEAAALLAETHAGKLLQGLRGQPAGDIPALLDVIERVAQLALTQPRLQELDINPLIVYPHEQGVLAVDVRMVVTAD